MFHLFMLIEATGLRPASLTICIVYLCLSVIHITLYVNICIGRSCIAAMRAVVALTHNAQPQYESISIEHKNTQSVGINAITCILIWIKPPFLPPYSVRLYYVVSTQNPTLRCLLMFRSRAQKKSIQREFKPSYSTIFSKTIIIKML